MSDFGLRTGTEVFKTSFYKGRFRAQTGTIVLSRLWDFLGPNKITLQLLKLQLEKC